MPAEKGRFAFIQLDAQALLYFACMEEATLASHGLYWLCSSRKSEANGISKPYQISCLLACQALQSCCRNAECEGGIDSTVKSSYNEPLECSCLSYIRIELGAIVKSGSRLLTGMAQE